MGKKLDKKAKAGKSIKKLRKLFKTPVKISARMMPDEMTANGILPLTNARIVASRMSRVISNGVIKFLPETQRDAPHECEVSLCAFMAV